MSTGIPRIHDGLETLSLLVQRVDAFADAWDRDGEPRIESFLSDVGPLRRIVLIELIKVDLEFRWVREGQKKFIEDYVAEFPELGEPKIPPELILEEMHVQQQVGLDDCAQTIQNRFPNLASDLEGTETKQRLQASYSVNRTRRPDHIQVGQLVGDFKLLAQLGQGAFANVFLASQSSIGARRVALKVSGDFGTEPANLGQLQHDCIVAVHGVESLADRAVRLLCMEFVPGGTLHDVIKQIRERRPEQRNGGLLLECVDHSLAKNSVGAPADVTTRNILREADWTYVVCWIGIHIAKGLDYAHRQGVLHRDIKPANILLSANCLPKLADFNTSFNSHDCTTTAAAFFGGSLSYMSPEQLAACLPPWKADALDGRSDIFSLGVVLWELSTGIRPWIEQEVCSDWTATIESMLARRREELPYHSESPETQIPWALFRVLQPCLDANVETRIPSGKALVRQLETCREPNTRRLLYPPPDSLRFRCGKWTAVVLMLLVVHVFNGFLAVFNYQYNLTHIAEMLNAPQQLASLAMTFVNPIAFGIGTLLLYRIVRPILFLERFGPTEQSINNARRVCLRSGAWIALIGLAEWAVAGLVYPTVLHVLSTSDSSIQTVTLEHYLHFAGSHVLCGAIAAVYVYFLITELSISFIYPRLLLNHLNVDQDRFELRKTQVTSVRWLLLAGLIPLVALMGMATVGSASTFMQVLSCAGVAAIALAFRCYQVIQRSIDSLLAIE